MTFITSEKKRALESLNVWVSQYQLNSIDCRHCMVMLDLIPN